MKPEIDKSFSITKDRWYHWPIRIILKLFYRTDGYIHTETDFIARITHIEAKENWHDQ